MPPRRLPGLLKRELNCKGTAAVLPKGVPTSSKQRTQKSCLAMKFEGKIYQYSTLFFAVSPRLTQSHLSKTTSLHVKHVIVAGSIFKTLVG